MSAYQLQISRSFCSPTALFQSRYFGNFGIEIGKAANGFEKLFRADFSEPHRLLAPVAESATDLLCYGVPANIKKCENPDCVLFFYDTTKNHSRRWCSMQICGNRAKAAAFYQRGKMKTGGKQNKLKS